MPTVDTLLLLRLLTEQAPLEELHELFRQVREGADHDDPDARVALEELHAYAIELHHARADDRRRALGLTALSDTAADLAALRDLDELLEAVCARARLLLGTDAAYITLRDDDAGDTYVRMTTGIVSSGFRTMRLPWGIGIGGLVAEEAATLTTSDYAADDRFAHMDNIDERVRIEGLRGIAATPLRRGDRVLGVLMSGSRSTRHFEPAEISLFEALAHHAAVAIENARLLADARAAVEAAVQANAEVRAYSDAVARVASLQERLTTLVLEGAGLSELLVALSEAVGGRVTFEDSEGVAVASAGLPSDTDEPATGSLDVPVVVAGGEGAGTLKGDGIPLDDHNRDLLERGAAAVSGLLWQLHTASAAETRRRSELIDELFDRARVDEDMVRRHAERLGMDLDQGHVVIAAHVPGAAVRWGGLRAERRVAAQNGALGTIDGIVIVLVPGVDATAVAHGWSTAFASDADGDAVPTIGAAGPASGLQELGVAQARAVRALRILLALGRDGETVTTDDLGIFGVLFGHEEPNELRGFLERTLGPVLDHDSARGNDQVLSTLEAYFAEGGNLASTARRLGIHINTIYQRVERLNAILGDDWRRPDRGLELHLALRLRALDTTLRRERP